MSFGSRSRRLSTGFVAIGVLAGLAGCQMPVGRLAPLPNRPQSTLTATTRAALFPATVAMDPPSEMSSIEPTAPPASSLTPSETRPEPEKPAPTPLLDAALIRAKGLEEARDRPDRPSPPTDPTPIPIGPIPATESPAPLVVPVTSTIPTPSPMPTPVPGPMPTPEPVKEAEPARPEDLWREGVRRLVGLARARLEQPSIDGPDSNSTRSWTLRSRVLAWLAEPDLDPDLGHREADGVRAVLRALDDASGESVRRGDEVRSAVLVLEDKAPLEITDLRICSKVDGFGDFEAFEPPVRKAGQPVILYCEVDGLRFEQTTAGFRTRIAAQLEILPEGGGPAIHSRSLSTAEETCRRRRRDYFVAYKFILPKPLEPGDYRIRLTTRDLNGDHSATREVSFAVAKD